MLRRFFLDHPRSAGETYFEHMGVAFGFSARLFAAAAICFVHGLVPGCFERTGSGMVARLQDRMTRRARKASPPL